MPKSYINEEDVKEYFNRASLSEIKEFLEDGLLDLIVELELHDYFGTEGFNRRFA